MAEHKKDVHKSHPEGSENLWGSDKTKIFCLIIFNGRIMKETEHNNKYNKTIE